MTTNQNDKTFEVKLQETQDLGDNSPINVPSTDQSQWSSTSIQPKSDRVLWYTIGGITLTACIVIFLLIYTFFKNNPFPSSPPFVEPPTPQPTSRATPNKQATHMAWTKPPDSPMLGSAEEAQRALNAGNVKRLRSVASYLPDIPRIPQPGEIYFYGIRLDEPQPLLWDYTWCARSTGFLDSSLGQMKIEFTLNTVPVPSTTMAVNDYQENDKSICRTYIVLITVWPEGIHLLETDITFLKPTNNGRSEYPAGMHTFQYLVTVRP